ncbi:MAG: prepilin-type N-terminal cleavage/methylation domain-containing protein [Nitrospirae bacterium]|nr:prepilin-type N-terminal cleavage/methylation domain-containing protein [Nitrospirota bacterium]
MNDKIYGKSGFTLMEVLIAITIFSVIAVIMSATVKLCLRSVEKGDKKVESTERLRAVVRVIESQLQSFVPMMYSDNGTTKQFYCFKGSEDSLVFVSNVSAWGRDRGTVAVKYEINSEGALVETEWDMLKNNKRSLVLLTNMKGTTFNFTIHRPEDVDPKTAATIDKTDFMPGYVQISSPLLENDINVPIMASNILQSSTTSTTSTTSKTALFDPEIFQ